MDHEFADGRLLLRRTPDERTPLLQRLRRIEGQVRGLQTMIEEDRHCLDEMQQINAVLAALREVAVMIAGQHVSAGLEEAVENGRNAEAVEEIKAVLRAALKQT